jgi:hypothetical protein
MVECQQVSSCYEFIEMGKANADVLSHQSTEGQEFKQYLGFLISSNQVQISPNFYCLANQGLSLS